MVEPSTEPLAKIIPFTELFIFAQRLIDKEPSFRSVGCTADGTVTREDAAPTKLSALVAVDGRGVVVTTPEPTDPLRRRSVNSGRDGECNGRISQTAYEEKR